MFAYASIHAEDYLLDISFELKDKSVVQATAAKMKIAFPVTSGPGDNIIEFMENFVSHLRSLASHLIASTRK